MENLHSEMQDLIHKLLLAIHLGQGDNFFQGFMDDVFPTLRLLHHPPSPLDGAGNGAGDGRGRQGRLCRTGHINSGILMLLYKDQNGGLEVLVSEECGGENGFLYRQLFLNNLSPNI